MAKNTIASCEKKATTAEVSRCLGGIKEKKNRELQTWINNQTYILEDLARSSGRRTVLDMFERAQRNFIDYRENNCRWQYLAVSPDASAAVAFKKCYITLTQYRIDELAKLGE
ncbi:MAG: lysozyme inhibitor LprI family protein [Cognaticolwellia sp.]